MNTGCVHRKYERTKQVVEGFKANEEQLKKHVEDYKVNMRVLLRRFFTNKLEDLFLFIYFFTILPPLTLGLLSHYVLFH